MAGELQIWVDDSVDPIVAGNTVTYTITITNTSGGRLQNIDLTNTLPTGFTYVDSSVAIDTGDSDLAAGIINWDLGALKAGESTTITLTAQIDSSVAEGSYTSAIDVEAIARVGKNRVTVSASETEDTYVEVGAPSEPPTIEFLYDAGYASEGDNTDVKVVKVVLRVPGGGNSTEEASVIVRDTGNGTATAEDYEMSDYTVTFAAGTADGTIMEVPVTVFGDTLIESNETIELEIIDTDGTNNIGNQATFTATIGNDDFPTIEFADATTNVAEGDAGSSTTVAPDVVLHVNSSDGVLGEDLHFSIFDTGAGSATSGEDYNAIASVDYIFLAGATDGQTLSAALAAGTAVRVDGPNELAEITINGDATPEANESISLTLSVPAGESHHLGNQIGHAIFIDNDDNSVPDAVDDTATVVTGESVTIDVLGNDVDPDGDPLSIAIDTQPQYGSVVESGGAFIYTPNVGHLGGDSFTYTVDDGQGGTDTATVNITVVDVKIIYVNLNATGAGDGSSWADAYTGLDDALNDPAAANSQIWIAGGTYQFDSADRSQSYNLVDGVKIYGGFVGSESSLAERDLSNPKTILSGELGDSGNDGDNAYTVVTAGSGITATIDGVTITKGYSDSGVADINGQGGGIHANDANLTINNVIFTDNFASNGGGAILHIDNNVTVTNSYFIDNTSSNSPGGAISSMRSIDGSGELSVENSIFTGNSGFAAGAIVGSGVTVNVTGSTFYANSHADDMMGFINADSIAMSSGQLYLNNSILWGGNEQISYTGNPDLMPIVNYSNVQTASGVYSGEGNINADPMFVNSSDPLNGGLELQSGSPCIDTGSNSEVVGTGDIDGDPRHIDGDDDATATVDMGAHEHSGVLGAEAYYGLHGTEDADILNGTADNEYVDGKAGADDINAGDGDDAIVYDAADTTVDGGSGSDVLIVDDTSGDVIDLSASALSNLETISLEGNAKTVTGTGSAVTEADVLNVSGGGDALTIDAKNTDSSITISSEWQGGALNTETNQFEYYTGASLETADTILYIDADITVTQV